MATDSRALPQAAARWLRHACPAGRFPAVAELRMTGRIKISGWLPFRAHQRLDAAGFRWSARAGWGPLCISGYDGYHDGAGEMRWHLGGILPVVRASGADLTRSAAWRYAAEALTWLPGPGSVASWSAADGRTEVRVPVGAELAVVTLHLAPSGALRAVSGLRWGNPDQGAFQYHPFGVDVFAEATFDGITVPSEISASWWWGTGRQAQGEFFRATLTSARYTFD